MEKVIKYCVIKNRWVGMIFYNGGMVKAFFYGKKPKMRQLKGLAKKAKHQVAVNATAESDWYSC